MEKLMSTGDMPRCPICNMWLFPSDTAMHTCPQSTFTTNQLEMQVQNRDRALVALRENIDGFKKDIDNLVRSLAISSTEKEYWERQYHLLVTEKYAVREPVRWFAEQMEKKLKANDHKGGWTKDMLPYLGRRFGEEVNEFVEAMASGDESATINEAADVANFAMMIADLCRPQPDNGKDGG